MEKVQLFEVIRQVRPGSAAPLHPRFSGARVTAYAIAATRDAAVAAVGAELVRLGHEMVPEWPPVRVLDPSRWDEYVDREWAGLRGHLPRQEEILAAWEPGRVFLGAFLPVE